MEINSLNYLATYKWKINDEEEQIRSDTVCFASLYNQSRNLSIIPVNNGTISIKVYFSKEMNQNMVDNYCLLSESELAEYIEWIKKITKFNIRISKGTDIKNNYNDTNYKIITVKFTKKMPYEIKLICALIRNIYECPYNIMVKTAFLLKSNVIFENMDFTERFCMSINSIAGYNTGHSTFYESGVDIYTDKSLRKRYLKAARTENNVNGFMLNNNSVKFNRYYYRDVVDEDTEENIFDTLEENYISDEFRKILIRNYKIMKENER